MENRGLNFALLEGYHTALMKGRYPVCCLFLEIDPAAVDVNIHPAKREVKFHREAEVRRLVAQAVRETLLELSPRAGRESAGQRSAAAARGPAPAAAPERPATAPNPPVSQTCPPPQLPKFPNAAANRRADVRRTVQPRRCAWVSAVAAQPAARPGPQPPARPAPPTRRRSPRFDRHPPPRPAACQRPGRRCCNVPLRLVGVIGKLYVVLESDRGLVLLDQHAAHERILFEQMLDAP